MTTTIEEQVRAILDREGFGLADNQDEIDRVAGRIYAAERAMEKAYSQANSAWHVLRNQFPDEVSKYTQPQEGNVRGTLLTMAQYSDEYFRQRQQADLAKQDWARLTGRTW